MIPIYELIWPGLFLLLFALWWKLQGLRQIALTQAKRHCEAMDVQLLDQSVALHKLRLRRDSDGQMKLYCSYQFEFSSTGAIRYSGTIVQLGGRTLSIDLDPYRI